MAMRFKVGDAVFVYCIGWGSQKTDTNTKIERVFENSNRYRVEYDGRYRDESEVFANRRECLEDAIHKADKRISAAEKKVTDEVEILVGLHRALKEEMERTGKKE